MKGQIFIIASVLVLVALLLTRLATKTVDKKQDEIFYESYTDLKNELIKTLDISLLNNPNQPEILKSNLDDFIGFSKDIFKKRGYIESVNYSVSTGTTTIIYLNVSLSSGNSYFLESLIINRTVYT